MKTKDVLMVIVVVLVGVWLYGDIYGDTPQRQAQPAQEVRLEMDEVTIDTSAPTKVEITSPDIAATVFHEETPEPTATATAMPEPTPTHFVDNQRGAVAEEQRGSEPQTDDGFKDADKYDK